MSIFERAAYRLRQFWLAVAGRPTQIQLEKAARVLTPVQFSLFRQLQLSEQAHALDVLERVQAAGHTQPELMQAALLHDVGKAQHGLRIWERVWIVIGGRLFPQLKTVWAEGQLRGLQRAFVIAVQHPAWGAEMTRAVDTDPRVVKLIALHQVKPIDLSLDENMKLMLRVLQAADDES